MRRKLMTAMAAGALLAALAVPGWAQQAASGEGEKQIVKGPSTNLYGRFRLQLPSGAESEIDYQPDVSSLQVKTIAGEARIVTSARYLLLVETETGRIEILLASGRVINVEPGRAEIVGQALVDDPGETVVRLNGTGPFVAPPAPGAPGAPGIGSQGRVTLLTGTPAAALSGADIQPGPTAPTTQGISPFAPAFAPTP